MENSSIVAAVNDRRRCLNLRPNICWILANGIYTSTATSANTTGASLAAAALHKKPAAANNATFGEGADQELFCRTRARISPSSCTIGVLRDGVAHHRLSPDTYAYKLEPYFAKRPPFFDRVAMSSSDFFRSICTDAAARRKSSEDGLAKSPKLDGLHDAVRGIVRNA